MRPPRRTVLRAREVCIDEAEKSSRFVLVLECGHTTAPKAWWQQTVRKARRGADVQAECLECAS